MFTSREESSTSFSGIIDALSVVEVYPDTFYVASSPEDYRRLVRAALDGELDGVVSVGRSGIYLNRLLINPPGDQYTV